MVTVFESENAFDKAAFKAVCDANGFVFPKEYLEYLEQHNDGELDANVISDFDDCAVDYFYGTTSESYSDFAENLEMCRGRMPEGCVPIAEAEGGNLLCMSLEQSSYGAILWWDHETMDVDEGEQCPYSIGEMYVVAKDFSELLTKIVPDDDDTNQDDEAQTKSGVGSLLKTLFCAAKEKKQKHRG